MALVVAGRGAPAACGTFWESPGTVSSKLQKKPPLLMRERKRDYAGACGQYLYTEFYEARRNPSTGKQDFLEKFFAAAPGRTSRPVSAHAIHAE
jgi:hypothetical protein